jgi:hypothetical protein
MGGSRKTRARASNNRSTLMLARSSKAEPHAEFWTARLSATELRLRDLPGARRPYDEDGRHEPCQKS